jgi:hypothetical protein
MNRSHNAAARRADVTELGEPKLSRTHSRPATIVHTHLHSSPTGGDPKAVAKLAARGDRLDEI